MNTVKKVIFIFIAWVAIIFLVNKVSSVLLVDRTSYELPQGISIPARFTLLPFLNFDGRNYLNISLHGYFVNDLGQSMRAFFPLYPLLISFFHAVGFNPVVAGFLISYLSAFGAVFLFYLLAKKDFGEKVALRSVVILLTFPTSFYFICYYTESLFLFLTLLTFWFLRRSVNRASIFAFFASACRFFGVVLTPVLLWEAWDDYMKNKRISWMIILAPLGFIFYFLYTGIISGNLFSLISSYEGYSRTPTLFGPISIYWDSLKNVFQGVRPTFDSPFVYPVIVLEFLSLVFLTFMVVYTYKKIKTTYWIYLVSSFIIVLFISYPSSLPRYMLTLFPIHIFLGSRLNGFRYYLYIAVSFILMAILSGLFLRGYWVS